MIPKFNQDLKNDFKIEEQTSNTFAIDINKGYVTGKCDGIEAVKQAIYLMLNIERYEHIIYSWNYAIETYDLIGKDTSYVLPELKRRITEALTQDTRILGVDAFNFDVNKGKVHAIFVVQTIYGEVKASKEVSI